MKSAKTVAILLALACTAIFIAGCTTTTTTTFGNPSPAQTAAPAAPAGAPAVTGAAAQPAVPVAATTPACPDKEVLTGSWDSREVGYASNHDVRGSDVWADAGPVPVTLTQKCWDVTGTFRQGECDGTLTGRMEKGGVFSGTWRSTCTNAQDSGSGAFTVSMAADNQSFIGEMYNPSAYGPDAGFPPSWLAKKNS